MIKKIFILALCTLFFELCVPRLTLCADASDNVKKGNKLYGQGKYDEALKYYNEAEIYTPDSDVINFNKGTALYQKGDYEQAIEAFTKALLSDNHAIEEKAAYNIGNSKFRSGKLKENTDLASAVEFYRHALEYYKRAIEMNQNNTNAKYNHEFVERELKVLLDKLKQQQEQQDNQQEQEQEQGQEKEQTQSASSEQQEKEQEAAQKEEEKEGLQEEQPQEQAKGSEPEQDAQEEMSEEEARMILDRYNQQEQPFSSIDRDTKNSRYSPVLKDW